MYRIPGLLLSWAIVLYVPQTIRKCNLVWVEGLAQLAFVASLPSLFLEICGAWELVADTSKEQWGKQTYYKPAQGQSINELIH